jgi:hypothetical protein
MMPADPVPLTHLSLDLPAPLTGWAAELRRRGIPVELDDIGRPSISRAAARDLFTEQRESEARRARLQREADQRAAEAAQAQPAAGIPASVIPEGVSAAQYLMLSDPDRHSKRRQSVLEHALSHRDSSIIFHPFDEAS